MTAILWGAVSLLLGATALGLLATRVAANEALT
jgi:hypothetical protein